MKTNNNIPAYRFQGYTDAWELRKLRNIFHNIENAFVGIATPHYVSDGRFYLESNNIKDGQVNYETKVFISEEFYQRQKNKWLRAGDIVMVQSGHVGHSAVIPEELDCSAAHALIMFRKQKVKISSTFLNYQFQTKQSKKKLDLITTGNTIKHILSSEMKEFNANFPTYPEQEAIGTFFSTLDRHITLHQRKLDTLKEQKKTYLKLLFPAKGQTQPALRFQDFEDDWEEVKLREVLIKNSKRNKDLRIINVESVSNRLGFVKQTEQFEDYSVASSDLSNYYVISEKQFAYNPSRINVGSIAYKKLGDESSVVSPLYISFSTSENVEDYYLWYWFKTELFHSQRIVFSEGGVRDTLSYNQLSEIILSLPSLPEQEAIGTFFQTLDQEIAQVEDKLASLKEMKKTLLRKLFV
ncbi:restriction endonuclease subunit S [Streptococcus suis]